MGSKLTRVQMARDFIEVYVEQYGHVPSIRDVATALGVTYVHANNIRARVLNPAYDAACRESNERFHAKIRAARDAAYLSAQRAAYYVALAGEVA